MSRSNKRPISSASTRRHILQIAVVVTAVIGLSVSAVLGLSMVSQPTNNTQSGPASSKTRLTTPKLSNSEDSAKKEAPKKNRPQKQTPKTPTPKQTAPAKPTTQTKPTPKPSGSNSAKKLVKIAAPPSNTTAQSSPVPVPEKTYGSVNWSGYVIDSSNFTSISGSWTVPYASGIAGTDSYDASWVGIGGFHGQDLIQAGTMNIVQANGQQQSVAFYEILPAAAVFVMSLPVQAGNNVTTSIKETSANLWNISIRNNTTGQTYTKNLSYQSAHTTAAWIQEVPSKIDGSLYAFNNFGTVSFSGISATLNGKTVNLAHKNLAEISLFQQGSQSTILAKPKILSSTSFSVTRQ